MCKAMSQCHGLLVLLGELSVSFLLGNELKSNNASPVSAYILLAFAIFSRPIAPVPVYFP